MIEEVANGGLACLLHLSGKCLLILIWSHGG